jgi:hypothetical protein
VIVLDACCTLTLAGSGVMEDLLDSLPVTWRIGKRSRDEALWLATPDPEVRELVDLSPLIERGLLAEAVLSGPEEHGRFAELAALVDDGEAEAGALALHRGWVLATDDRATRRVLGAAPYLCPLRSTVELLQAWEAAAAVAPARMREVLLLIEERATYRPRRTSADGIWWDAILAA